MMDHHRVELHQGTAVWTIRPPRCWHRRYRNNTARPGAPRMCGVGTLRERLQDGFRAAKKSEAPGILPREITRPANRSSAHSARKDALIGRVGTRMFS